MERTTTNESGETRLFDIPQSEILVDIARRVDYLTLLYAVEVATYRQELNFNAVKMHISATDYTSVDYDYVVIARKTRQDCVGALLAMPGKRYTTEEIDEVLNECATLQSSIPIPSYTLKGRRLVLDSYRCIKHMVAFFDDVCPRTGKKRMCFSIAFLKQLIPDLLGDASVQPIRTAPQKERHVSIGPCLICFENKRDVLFVPCHHFIVCSRCSDKIQKTECLVCKQPITKTEKIYT